MAGHEPIKDPLILTLGADFVHRYKKNESDPEFPAGTESRIEVYTSKDSSTPVATWSASLIDTEFIEFRVESEDTDEIPARYHYRLYVVYPDEPTLDMCWCYGDITRKQ